MSDGRRKSNLCGYQIIVFRFTSPLHHLHCTCTKHFGSRLLLPCVTAARKMKMFSNLYASIYILSALVIYFVQKWDLKISCVPVSRIILFFFLSLPLSFTSVCRCSSCNYRIQCWLLEEQTIFEDICLQYIVLLSVLFYTWVQLAHSLSIWSFCVTFSSCAHEKVVESKALTCYPILVGCIALYRIVYILRQMSSLRQWKWNNRSKCRAVAAAMTTMPELNYGRDSFRYCAHTYTDIK